jgi:hypothetical protein
MLKAFQCPNCGKKLQTDQGEGQTIPCPYCEEAFTLSREHAAQKNAASELFFRLAIPIGYVLFVAVPLGLTVWYLTTQMGDKPKEAADAAPGQVNRNDPKPPAPRPPVRPRKDGKAKAETEDPDGDPESAPKPPMLVESVTPAMPAG